MRTTTIPGKRRTWVRVGLAAGVAACLGLAAAAGAFAGKGGSASISTQGVVIVSDGTASPDRGTYRMNPDGTGLARISTETYARRGHELGAKRVDWRHPSQEWIESAERLAEVERNLDRVLSGEARPAGAPERVAFAGLLRAKSRPAEAARMYAEAFAEDAALAEDLSAGHRYGAACSASLATSLGGPDAAEWRGRALEWLRADLAAREKAASGLEATLRRWKKDPDLAGVRDRPGDLPEAEREAWTALWAAVDEALARTASR